MKAADISNIKMYKNESFARAGADLVKNTHIYKFMYCRSHTDILEKMNYNKLFKSSSLPPRCQIRIPNSDIFISTTPIVAGNTHEYVSKLLIKPLTHKLQCILTDR